MILARRLIGLALIGLTVYWAFAWWRSRPRIAVDAETGEVLGFRVSPLSRDEREAAEVLERTLHRISDLTTEARRIESSAAGR